MAVPVYETVIQKKQKHKNKKKSKALGYWAIASDRNSLEGLRRKSHVVNEV